MNIFNNFLLYFKLMRFHKPVGIWLLLFPTLWALWIVADGKPHFKNLFILILGTTLMRAAGCIINDIFDKNFDKHVARTKDRPITSGKISVKNAGILFLSLIAISGILVLQFNVLCIELAFFALFLACMYPLMKRWINYPQFFLSLAFGMGIPIAYAAEINRLNDVTLLLFIINSIWVLIYDTEYAMVDKKDDLKINIKSTAIWWGKYVVSIIGVLQLIMIILLIVLGIILKFNLIYYVSILMISILFIYQIYLIDAQKPKNCFKAFVNNQWVGFIIFLGLFIPHLDFYWKNLVHVVQ